MKSRLFSIASLLLGMVVSLFSSCVKEEGGMLISGTWAQVDDNMMTHHYVSFLSGNYSSYESEGKYLVAEHAIWNCLEKDFKCSNSSQYSVTGDVIKHKTGSFHASVDGETLVLDGKKYVQIESFKPGFYRQITFDSNTVECNFSGGNLQAAYTLQNFGTSTPTAYCDASWISGIVCSGNSVAFKVAPCTESRETSLVLSYYGASDKTLHIVQKANRTITANPEVVYSDYSKQNKSITVSVTNAAAGKSLEAKSQQSWISNIIISGNTINFVVAENNTGNKRDGSIVVSYPDADDLVIPVYQEYSAPAIYLSNNSFSLSPDAGEYTTGYSIDYPRLGKSISCKSKPEWVSTVLFTGSLVKFNVTSNNTESTRTGNIVLSYGSVEATVSLSQSNSTLTVSPSSWAAPVDGGVKEFAVTSNASWDISCNADWISVEKLSADKVKLTAAVNNSGLDRNAICTVKTSKTTKKINISQQKGTLTIGQETWNPSYTAESISLNVNTTGAWTISSDQSWVVLSKTSDSGNGTVTVSVGNNTANNAVSRSAVVLVKSTTYNVSASLTVKQTAFVPSLTINKSSFSPSSDANSYSLNVSSNISWKATSNSSWVSVNPASATVGISEQKNTSLSLSVEANSTTSVRSAVVTVYNDEYGITRTITVNQSAITSPYINVASSVNITRAEAASSTIDISSNIDWNVKSDQSWLTVKKASGTGNEGIAVSYTKNDTGVDRTATLTVYNTNYNIYKTITVFQKTFNLRVSTTSWVTSLAAATYEVQITSSDSWTVSTGASWLKVNKTSGTGNDTIEISVLSSSGNRSANVTVYNSSFGISRMINVKQIASASVSISSWKPNCGIQSKTVSVSSDGAWTATCSSWITLSRYSGSSGTTSLVIEVKGNNSTSSRTGSVIISNAGGTKSITLTQYGYTQCGVNLSYSALDLGIPVDRTATYTYVIKGWSSYGSCLLGTTTSSGTNAWRFYKSGSYYYFNWGSTTISFYNSLSTSSYRKFVLSNYALKLYSTESTTSYTSKTGTTQSSVPSSSYTIKVGSSSDYLTFKSLVVTNSSGSTTHNFIGVNTNGTIGIFDKITGELVVGGTSASL